MRAAPTSTQSTGRGALLAVAATETGDPDVIRSLLVLGAGGGTHHHPCSDADSPDPHQPHRPQADPNLLDREGLTPSTMRCSGQRAGLCAAAITAALAFLHPAPAAVPRPPNQRNTLRARRPTGLRLPQGDSGGRRRRRIGSFLKGGRAAPGRAHRFGRYQTSLGHRAPLLPAPPRRAARRARPPYRRAAGRRRRPRCPSPQLDSFPTLEVSTR